MKRTLIIILLGCWSFVTKAQRPNIVYILADDMGSGDVRIYNKDCKFPTPNIDALGKKGVVFTDAHTNSSVCTPTRYGILTGRYAWRTSLKKGVTHAFTPHLINLERTTVASYLKGNGYATACFGKWHLGMDWTTSDGKKIAKGGANIATDIAAINGPQALGFDEYFGISASLNMDPHAYVHNGKILGELEYIASEKEIKNKLGFGGGKKGWVAKDFKRDEVMQTFTDKTVAWMKSQHQQNPNQPFFVYMPLNAPHSPIAPHKKFLGKSGLSPHGDFCMDVDDTVGQVVKAIEDMGIADNTIVVFTADNGVSPQAKLQPMEEQGHFSSYVYRGLKGTLYEGGHRVPFIVKWPKKVKPGRSDYLMCTTDLLATVADIIGKPLKDNEGEDSVSFYKALKNNNRLDKERGVVVHHSDAGWYAIRKDQWKLIFHPKAGSRRIDPKDKPVVNPGKVQLFDMKNDKEESVNLARKYPEVVATLTKTMKATLDNGRSTPGKNQKNTPFEEKYLKLIAPFNQ